jgi:hypothetical protein
MTCQQFHDHLRNAEDLDFDPAGLSPEILQHISACATCKALVEQRSELGMSLQQFRNSAPEISASLDAAISASFRKLNELPFASSSVTPNRKRTPPMPVITCSAAVVAAAVIAVLILPIKKANLRAVPDVPAAPVISSEFPKLPSNGAVQLESSLALRSNGHELNQWRSSTSETYSQVPSGFTSLMYCDQLSCAGDMEVVRVQLSPSMLGLPPRRSDPAATIVAEVLVGADGIARGIRIEQ